MKWFRDPQVGRPVPVGLLGMLALVVLGEAIVAHNDLDCLSPPEWAWRLSGRKASRGAEGYRVLCFGDSQMQLGVAPPIIERRTGLRAYNFAVGGGQAAASYFLLRRALESGARPTAVLVDTFPALLRSDPRDALQFWPHLLDVRECLELCWVARDADLLAAILARRISPTFRTRLTLRAYLRAALGLRERPGRLRDQVLLLHRHLEWNDGAQIGPNADAPTADLAAWRRKYFAGGAPHPVNVAFLERFFALAASRRIPVLWLVPPIMPGLQDECARSGFDAEHTRFLHATRARFPGLVVVDGRGSGYDPRVFFDPHHLGRDGARAYSLALGEILSRRDLLASGPRWIDLPAYRPPPEDYVLLDVRQTSVAAARRASLRR